MLNNIFKLLKQEGTCLISVWSNTISKKKFIKLDNPGDYLIPWDATCSIKSYNFL